ncbi:protein of unknown function [Azospirillum baldaniorum]|uniref:Uncharacterized protein n=1 Tax=Azospirillum baldaniorum TaxID=1064539 RepID=A0A9P1JRW6_9PROT|nr:protein of unknown function [Azospirillum baldaniorum]
MPGPRRTPIDIRKGPGRLNGTSRRSLAGEIIARPPESRMPGNGAEGATAPETLRQKDRKGDKATLESSPVRASRGTAHRRSKPVVEGWTSPVNLSGPGQRGQDSRQSRRGLCDPMSEDPRDRGF